MSTYSVEHIYDEDNGTLVRQFIGEVQMDDLIDAWRKDINCGIVNEELTGVVTDFTHCNNKATMGELDQMCNFYNSHRELFRSFKNAVVLDTPGVVILLMFERQYTEFHHKAFCTLDAAFEWIDQ